MKLKSCTAAAWSGTSRNHVKSFIFTRFYKGFREIVTLSWKESHPLLESSCGLWVSIGGTSKT